MLAGDLSVIVDGRLLSGEAKTKRSEIHRAAHAGFGVQPTLAAPEKERLDAGARNQTRGSDVSAVEVVAWNVLVEACLIDPHYRGSECIDSITFASGADARGIEGPRGVSPEQWAHKSTVAVKKLLSAGAQDCWCVVGADLGVELSEICVVAERCAGWCRIFPRSTRVHALDKKRG